MVTMDLGKLATLKQRLVDAKDFREINDYFYDEFAEQPAFLSLCEPTEDTTIDEVLLEVGKRIVGSGAKLGQVMLFRLAGHGFVHGAFTIGRWMGSLLYFEDIERGMVVLGDMKGATHFARFSMVRTAKGRSFSLN